ncbi:Kelch repeat-containing protein [Segetibacter koreensis]|uniref:Kelch repeat-containing protein n=1 Tax=Segetibacter koreensis TaxID=398037 RepID=UPI00037C605F|nr:kelch repeat-containing protein [Segetibacter koreensis]
MKQNQYRKYSLAFSISALFLSFIFPVGTAAQKVLNDTGSWQTITSTSGAITGREENSYAAAGDKFYLLGGRGIAAVQEYNPANKTWTNKSKPPVEMNHFQAVTLNGLIYIVAGMNGPFPHERPLTKVYVYNPITDKWFPGSSIPTGRERGATGAIAYKNKIYVVGGIKDGHWAGWVNWFDEYNPATNTWRKLPDAPRARDHFNVVIIGDKLYVAGGRRSSASTGQTFQLTIPQVDVFDFTSGAWSTLPDNSNLPIPRAGAANVALGNEVIVIGGESGLQLAAHKETHALDVTTKTWRRLADLQTGRHGTGAIVSNQDIYIPAGAGNRGATPKLLTQEDYFKHSHTTPNGTALSQSPLTGNSSISFGSIPINSECSKTLTITNTGSNQDIIITSIAISGSGSFFYSAPYPFPFTISPGKSINVVVRFKPLTGGAQTGKLVVTHSGLTGSKTVLLSGTGTNSTLQVTNFTLVNTTTKQETALYNGIAINLVTSGKTLSIRANTSPAKVGSVVFNLSGPQSKTQTESYLPYALFGDKNGLYNPWTPAVGSYTLKATPYPLSAGAGTAGTALTVNFMVRDEAITTAQRMAREQGKVITVPEITVLKAYPNPSNKARFTVLLPNKIKGDLFYSLLSVTGSKLTTGKLFLQKPTGFLTFDFSNEMTSRGLYHLQVESKEQKGDVQLMFIK